jgi:hypothetical protein
MKTILFKAHTFAYLLILFFVTQLSASESFESPATVEDTNLKIVKLLNKITDDSIVSMETTGGFNYRYRSGLLSPFRFNVYVGKLSKKSEDSIVRIEATKNGEAKLLKTIIEVELNKNSADYKFEQALNPKYHVVSQTLNLVTPAASVLYNSYNSPFYTTSDTVIKMGTYAMIDMVILAIAAFYINNTKTGNKNIYGDLLNKPGPSKYMFASPHGEVVLAALLLPRIYRSVEAFHDTAAQNRIAELSYTYRF